MPFHITTALHGTLDTSHHWCSTTRASLEIAAGKVIAAATGTASLNLNWVK
jgi:hypothetical protein